MPMLKNVKITGGFWKAMEEKNRRVTMDAVYKRFTDTGRFAALRCDKENKNVHFFWDSDVAKWLEGAANVLEREFDPELYKKAERAISDIIASQWEDGYINSYYSVIDSEKRFTDRGMHELYCAGHLIEAAVRWYEATGEDRFLKAAEKYADLIHRIFVIQKSAGFVTPGHEEIELALIRLYRATGTEKYLETAKFFIDKRGKETEQNVFFENQLYVQSEKPVREMSEANGHAVRACYLYAAMALLANETGDKELFLACKRLYSDIVEKKMYITGGIGQSSIGEAFTVAYDLPPETAYAETCAAIGLMFFSENMLSLENDSVYADTIERIMYNGMLSGLSADGKSFFYENPLEINLRNHKKNVSADKQLRLPITQRREVFDCSCCPPNLNRVLSSMGSYIYRVGGKTLYIDQFIESEMEEGGIKAVMTTDYPYDSKITLSVSGAQRAAVRIPYWCDKFNISVPYRIENGYAYIENPAKIEIEFEMKPKLYFANPECDYLSGKAALMLGPVVYAAEGIDNAFNLSNVYIDENINAAVSEKDFSLGMPGFKTITIDGYVKKPSEKLYSDREGELERVKIKLIPYRLFANRGESDMRVWINYLQKK